MTDAPAASRREPAEVLSTLIGRPGATWRVFVLPDVRVMFVQLNKNACTSLKWMIAGIAGEDPASFGPGLRASTSYDDDIHDRRRWRKVPRLRQVAPEVWDDARPDNGWFVFAVTRDPYSRLFSAWQSKLLLENPDFYGYREQPWFPRHPATTESVRADFATFVEMFDSDPDTALRHDGHFADQVELLHEDLVTYSRIYDLHELADVPRDLRAHLETVGWTGEVVLPRLNDTPLRANQQVFAAGVRERIETIYAADFDRFGDRWDFAAVGRAPGWRPEQLAEVDRAADYGHHLGYLLHQAKTFNTKLVAARKRAEKQQARADALERLISP